MDSPFYKIKHRALPVTIAVAFFSAMGIGAAIERYYAGLSPASAASNPGPIGGPQGLPDFAALAKRVSPSVVNVSTTQVRKAAQDLPFGDNDEMGRLFERFFGAPRGPERRRGQGSGFIIGTDGTILTNFHVVDGAQKIVVTLDDGKNYDAKVLGADQKTDIAVIKITAGRRLPAVGFGDSDALQVGEWVMAIGNPFGLDHTVTSGIVSAKGRQIGAGPYENFIQTDASINPGNSGGPLINLRGEVVGINTAIFSQSGGNIGIGFAIPANSVKELLPQLRDKGKVVRGYLGTKVQKLTPEIAESLGMKQTRGALVAEVLKGGPAELAGVKAGDVIIELDRKEVKDSSDLPAQVARVAPGTRLELKVWRNGKEVALPITVGEMREAEVTASTYEGDLGLSAEPITPRVAENLGLDRAEGLLITAVRPGSAADEAGLRSGDIIVEVNRAPVKNLADYRRELARNENAKSVLLLVRRGQSNLFLALKR
jgi:serine protease Do